MTKWPNYDIFHASLVKVGCTLTTLLKIRYVIAEAYAETRSSVIRKRLSGF